MRRVLLLAAIWLSVWPAARVLSQDQIKLFKVVGPKDEVIIGLTADELRGFGPLPDLDNLARHLSTVTRQVEEGDARYLAMELLSDKVDYLPQADIFSLGARWVSLFIACYMRCYVCCAMLAAVVQTMRTTFVSALKGTVVATEESYETFSDTF